MADHSMICKYCVWLPLHADMEKLTMQLTGLACNSPINRNCEFSLPRTSQFLYLCASEPFSIHVAAVTRRVPVSARDYSHLKRGSFLSLHRDMVTDEPKYLRFKGTPAVCLIALSHYDREWKSPSHFTRSISARNLKLRF